MSLVENLINQISAQNLGGVTKPQGFDMNDLTFENLLQKGLDSLASSQPAQTMGNFGIPAGLNIEELNAPKKLDEVKPIDTSEFQIKDIDMDDFFTNALKTQSADNNGIFDFAKKYATSAYNVFAGKYITDIKDFISDTMALS